MHRVVSGCPFFAESSARLTGLPLFSHGERKITVRDGAALLCAEYFVPRYSFVSGETAV